MDFFFCNSIIFSYFQNYKILIIHNNLKNSNFILEIFINFITIDKII